MTEHHAARNVRRGYAAAALAVTLVCLGAAIVIYALVMAPTPPPQPTRAQAGSLGVSSAVTKPLPRILTPSKPVSLQIPSIGVNAPLDALGLNPNGTVQVPTRPLDAGWFTGSASPGQPGAAVILGHVDFYSTGPAVFYSLGALAPGATVTVTRQDGSSATFTVTAVREFPKSAFPTAEIYEATGADPQLRLITCGSWDARRHAYTGNTVAFATLTAVTGPAATPATPTTPTTPAGPATPGHSMRSRAATHSAPR